MNNSTEKVVWKDVVGYEGRYKVSNTGQVKSISTGKIRKMTKEYNGYYRLTLHKDGTRKKVSIHRLVAKAFIDNPSNKKTVNHKDGNKLNNHSYNLEWATISENVKHAFENGLMVMTKEQACKANEARVRKMRKPVVCINNDTGKSFEFPSMNEAARQLNMNPVSISESCHKGFNAKNYKCYLS